MPVECAFTLPTGKKCRCLATRDHAFCRHHGAPPTGRPHRDPRVWSRRACWRDLGRSAAKMPRKDAVLEAIEVLEALRENRIADRTAGRLLRDLLQGWDEVPLMPTPNTGWRLRQTEPSCLETVPAQSGAQQPRAVPTDTEIANIEDLRNMIDQLCRKMDEGGL
jgi:hypothetical protein